jgi:CRISPR-associated protein (Cas_Cmr3)
VNEMDCAFLVRPLEPLYFGGPSSFSAGEKHNGRTLFPPSPITFQGLVRSHLLHSVVSPQLDLNDWSRAEIKAREQLVGGPDALLAGWQIQGPFPACRSTLDEADEQLPKMVITPWVPVPRFLLRHGCGPLHARPVSSPHPGLNDLGDDADTGSEILLLGRPEQGALSPLQGWIGPDNLWFALAGEDRAGWHKDQFGAPLPPFITEEVRPGVAIDEQRHTSSFGMLYSLSTLRFKASAGLVGWFSGRLDERISRRAFFDGVAGAGRKRRLVAFEEIPDFHPTWKSIKSGAHLPSSVKEKQLFWLLALTPACISNALAPELRAQFPEGVRTVIRSALTGPPGTLGGYQMATGRSRANQPYVPAGSAWLFHLEGGDDDTRAQALRRLHDRHILGPAREAGFGFGHTMVGIGPLEKGVTT